MLQPEGKRKTVRQRGSRWALLLMLPVALLAWALIGMRVEWGDRYFQTR